MELLLILTSFGIATAVIGRAKGSSGFIWGIVGFCLPFIGLALVILYRREDEEPERKCPRCGATHKLHVQVCNRCGLDMYLPETEAELNQFGQRSS